MTSLERVVAVLNHQEPDHVPAYPLCNSISRIYTGIDYAEWTQNEEKCAESIIKATEELGLDVICSLVDLSVEAADWGMKMRYPTDAAAGPDTTEHFITKPEDFDKVVRLDPHKTRRMSGHLKLVKMLYDAKGKDTPIVAFVFGPLGVLSMMTGLAPMFKFLRKCPEKVHQALRNVTDTLKDYCTALIEESGCHAIMFDTLYASQTIMRASMWDEWEGPYIQELAELVHGKDTMVMIHNCGDGIYFKEQIERMHPQAISTLFLPPDCKTMEECKEKYGDQITIIGSIPPSNIVTDTEEQIRAECRREMDAYKKNGGFILSTGCEYPAQLPDHYARVIVEEARTYGKY